MDLAAATRSDLEYVLSLLERCGLPTDLEGAEFYVARTDGERVGCGGLETHVRVALLRSIAVEPSLHGEGYGREITERLCTIAADRGVERLYLLTDTADAFFERRDFERMDRERVPDAIARTKQFAELCPESAICMRRVL